MAQTKLSFINPSSKVTRSMIEKQNIHFIGIGGIGMSAIAEVMEKV